MKVNRSSASSSKNAKVYCIQLFLVSRKHSVSTSDIYGIEKKHITHKKKI